MSDYTENLERVSEVGWGEALTAQVLLSTRTGGIRVVAFFNYSNPSAAPSAGYKIARGRTSGYEFDFSALAGNSENFTSWFADAPPLSWGSFLDPITGLELGSADYPSLGVVRTTGLPFEGVSIPSYTSYRRETDINSGSNVSATGITYTWRIRQNSATIIDSGSYVGTAGESANSVANALAGQINSAGNLSCSVSGHLLYVQSDPQGNGIYLDNFTTGIGGSWTPRYGTAEGASNSDEPTIGYVNFETVDFVSA